MIPVPQLEGFFDLVTLLISPPNKYYRFLRVFG